jgi:hypothetical protein
MPDEPTPRQKLTWVTAVLMILGVMLVAHVISFYVFQVATGVFVDKTITNTNLSCDETATDKRAIPVSELSPQQRSAFMVAKDSWVDINDRKVENPYEISAYFQEHQYFRYENRTYKCTIYNTGAIGTKRVMICPYAYRAEEPINASELSPQQRTAFMDAKDDMGRIDEQRYDDPDAIVTYFQEHRYIQYENEIYKCTIYNHGARGS